LDRHQTSEEGKEKVEYDLRRQRRASGSQGLSRPTTNPWRRQTEAPKRSTPETLFLYLRFKVWGLVQGLVEHQRVDTMDASHTMAGKKPIVYGRQETNSPRFRV